MLSKAAAKALWVTKGAALFGGAVVTLALVFGAASVAFGANGDNFILGKQNNVASALTRLTGSVQGAQMEVQNNDPGTDDTALSLKVQPGEAPMKVLSGARVDNLNADRLDGKHADGFLPNTTYTKEDTGTGFDTGGPRLLETFCDGGDVILSGGHFGLDAGTTLAASGPEDFHQGWQVQWINDATLDTITVSALCADFGAPHTP